MIETIIITALVSVISTLVFGYFIWSGIRVHKLNKQVKDNNESIQNLYRQIEELNNLLNEKEVELYNHINNVDQELNSKINNEISEIDNKLNDSNVNVDNRFDELQDKFSEFDQELHRELDKRFDRVYQIINERVQLDSLMKEK